MQTSDVPGDHMADPAGLPTTSEVLHLSWRLKSLLTDFYFSPGTTIIQVIGDVRENQIRPDLTQGFRADQMLLDPSALFFLLTHATLREARNTRNNADILREATREFIGDDGVKRKWTGQNYWPGIPCFTAAEPWTATTVTTAEDLAECYARALRTVLEDELRRGRTFAAEPVMSRYLDVLKVLQAEVEVRHAEAVPGQGAEARARLDQVIAGLAEVMRGGVVEMLATRAQAAADRASGVAAAKAAEAATGRAQSLLDGIELP